MTKCSLIFVLFFIIFCCTTKAKIHSSQYLDREISPTLISQDDNADSNSLLMSRYKRFLLYRERRAAPSGQKKLKSYKFDLNDTTHNQALIHWSGKNSSVIFILTRKKKTVSGGGISDSSLWRSTNYGKTYEPEWKKFDNKTILNSYFVCPGNISKVIFIDTYNNCGRIWVSTTEGETYTPYMLPFSLDKIEFHPEEQDWLLGYDKQASVLYCSQDLGKTWSKLQSYVTTDRYFWYVKDVDTIENSTSIVHFEYRDMDVFPGRTFLVKSCFIPNCDPTPFQLHCDELGGIDRDSLVVQDNYTFAQKPGAREKLYVSFMRGKFVKADFPGNNEQTDFYVVSSNGGTVVVGINHIDWLAHLFFSDITGVKYSQSLSNVRYFGRKSGTETIFNVDIYEVKAVKGTFITNKHTSIGHNVTMITWDNGRTWTNLAIPTTETACSGCTLNVHISMSQTKAGYYVPSIYSKETTPGLIITHGSVGQTLVDAPSSVQVYLSRDAGNTWNKVLDKRHLYIVADHGAMIVAAQMIFLQLISVISFSNDMGRTWHKYTFTDERIHVDGLLTEPGEYTHKFTLFGHRNYRDHWKLFALDLAPLVARNCTYPQDYVNVSFARNTQNSNQCHLGMRQTFEQLKEGNCLVGSEYKRVTTTELCPCTDIDYECGYGYITTSSGCKKVVGKGSPIDDIRDILDEDTTPTIPPCVNGLRKMPTQYRKVPGDQCQNDLEGKLFTIVNCSIVVTPPPPPTIHVKLLNKTNEVKIGEVLHFTAVSNSETVWSVIRTAEPKDKITTRPVKRDEISLNPTKPGAYQVRASNPKHPTVSDTMLVSFWYPIENVLIYCPPVVEVDTPFNATATLATKYGLRGTSSLLGRVSYIWSTENSDYKEVSENLISIRPTKLKDYGVMVTVNNKVSFSSGHGNFTVKKYVQTVVVPLESNTNLTDDLLTHTWLRDLQAMFARALIEKQLINILHANQMLQNKRFHLFIEPNLPLTAKLLFSHDKDGQPSSDALLKIAAIIEQKLATDKIVLHLPHGVVLTSKVPYMINAKGVYIYMKKSGTSPGIIVLIILLCVLLITSIVAMVRRYSRNSRWNSYLGSWKPHLRSSRGRSQDHTAIVDQDQLMENELDTMDISTTIQGNMQIG